MSREAPARRTLADVIMEKIQDKKTEIESHMSGKKFIKITRLSIQSCSFVSVGYISRKT